MAKIGRNEPCPCGSGRKYKRCCGDRPVPAAVEPEPAPAEAMMPDRRAMERTMLDITRLLSEQRFATAEEGDTFLQQLIAGGQPPPRRAGATPVERAQDQMYDAWAASGPRRVQLARQALKISPDCADAYVLLAEETARTYREARDLYAQGVAAGERALGTEAFEDDTVGHFWGVIETRPYMRARFGLAGTLWQLGQQAEAIGQYRAMLRLNPGDNQGVRYLLLPAFLAVHDFTAAKELLDQYPDEASAAWSYGRVLLAFATRGASRSAQSQLKKAVAANPHVPDYLLGAKRLPKKLPAYIGLGDEREAISYVAENLAAWQETPGALDWLLQTLTAQAALSPAERERATISRALRPVFDQLVQVIEPICRQHLNDEYAEVSIRLAAALCRKRPSPVTRGRLDSWACGIVYAIGSANFLFDRSQEPYLSAGELCALFGVSASNGSAKAGQLRKLFDISYFNPEWNLPGRLDDNPMLWMISVNGLLMDARHAPPEIQQEAFRRGLIPRLPETGD